jgi:hypothetical protein
MAPPKQSNSAAQFLYRFDVWLSLNDKDGEKVDRRKFVEFESQLYEKFRGLTRTPIVGNPIYAGYWEDPETLSQTRDMNTIYTVLTPQDSDSYEFFVQNKPTWTTHFKQTKILITVHQVEGI